MKNNVAGRLHVLLSRWSRYQDTEPAANGWIKALEINDPVAIRAQLLIYHKVNLLVDELDYLREQLAANRLTAEVYGPPLDKIEQALAPSLINLKCAHVKQHLTPDVFMALSFCSDILPHEEESISADDFSSLVSLISELELKRQDSSLPSSLSALIGRHIRLAEMAIADYPIRGAASLKNAVKCAIGDLTVEQKLANELSVETAITLTTLWEKMNKTADAAIKAEGLLQVGARIMQLLEKI